MSETYTKLSSNIVYSSMWQEDAETCKVWVTLLALKDRDGIVRQNMMGIASLIKIPREKIEEALLKFQGPDPHSTTPDHDGRRIEKVEGGYKILNHEVYQQLGWSEEKKTYERERKARYRASKTKERPETPKPSEPQSRKPTLDEVKLHAAVVGLSDAEALKFFNFYESKGWMIGKNKMKSVRHAMTNWKTRNETNQSNRIDSNPRNAGCVPNTTDYEKVVAARAVGGKVAQA